MAERVNLTSLWKEFSQPISFISISTVYPLEKSRLGFVGEAATVRWDMENFIKYLWGS